MRALTKGVRLINLEASAAGANMLVCYSHNSDLIEGESYVYPSISIIFF